MALGPTPIQHDLVSITTLNTFAKTLFPKESHLEVLDGHELVGRLFNPPHTLPNAVPACDYRMSVSGDSHLPESEAIFILDHQLLAWSSLGKSSKQMSIK